MYLSSVCLRDEIDQLSITLLNEIYLIRNFPKDAHYTIFDSCHVICTNITLDLLAYMQVDASKVLSLIQGLCARYPSSCSRTLVMGLSDEFLPRKNDGISRKTDESRTCYIDI